MTSFFQKLFGQRTGYQSTEVPTRPIAIDELEKRVGKSQLEPAQFIVGCAQSIGLQREHNEDALFTLTTTLTSDSNNVPFGFYVVADGMGGHQHGELASGIAVRNIASQIIQKIYTPFLEITPKPPQEPLHEIMHQAMQETHQEIIKNVPGGGTTLTAALIIGDQLTLTHVGDSRAYLISESGHMEVLTRDHSLVNRLVELGKITIDEAATHPQRNVLYRALGQGEPFDPDIRTTRLANSGYLLLCSDGLWGVISEDEIYHLVMSSPNPEQACQALVDSANKAGGPDNITTVLIRLS